MTLLKTAPVGIIRRPALNFEREGSKSWADIEDRWYTLTEGHSNSSLRQDLGHEW